MLNTFNNFQPTRYKGRTPRVNGRGGVEAFGMEPESDVFLADTSEENVVWFKTTDSAGYASATKFRLEKIDEDPPVAPQNYATKDDLDRLEAKLDKILEEFK